MTQSQQPGDASVDKPELARRQFFRRVLAGSAYAAAATASAVTATAAEAPGGGAWGGQTFRDMLGTAFQDHYQRMSPDEITAALGRIERRAKAKYGVDIKCVNTPPRPDTVYGYALNLSKCKGYRDCVSACIKENNQGRDSQVQYIRVLEMKQGSFDVEQANHYYEGDVPKPDHYYMPVQCQQCDNPPCVKACPTGATWREPDGIVAIDYDWCIGCRYCMTACPYWARHFNWTDPKIPQAEVNPNTHYLGNRPRPQGVVEKCHFCTQRTREGRQPACQEACPTGARIFGNLLDPNSEIRWVLANKKVFRLKEELGTEPKFWYYVDA